MEKKKLEIARNEIDQLDNSILNLIKKRTKIFFQQTFHAFELRDYISLFLILL